MLRESGHPVVAALLDVAMYPFRKTRAKVVPQARGRVLEVGLGTGANLPFYQGIDALVGVEPDPHMRRRAQARIAAADFPVELVGQGAEQLPFDDDSFDTVVATWVLCTIPDPEAAVREMRRVLRPDGVLLFAEHTLSPHPAPAAVQRALTPCWRQLAGGCHLDRDSVGLIRAFFTDVEVAKNRSDRYTIAPSYRGIARS